MKTIKKKEGKKDKKKELTKKQKYTVRGIFIGVFVASLLVNGLFFVNLQMEVFSTGAGDFNFNFSGIEIIEPYGDTSKSAVIFSDNYGNPGIDAGRTNWDFDPTQSADMYFDLLEDHPIDLDDKMGWVYGIQDKYSKLVGVDNSWYGSSGISIDIDSKNSGIPDLTISLDNVYPSDSNGEPDDTYDYEFIERTLIDSLGNERAIELGIGFITLELSVSIIPDYYIAVKSTNANLLQTLNAEVVGDYKHIAQYHDTAGASLSFIAVLRLDINELDFGEFGTLNPESFNFGNGILGVYKRGFGDVSEIDSPDDPYLIGTQDTTTWLFPGSNDIIATQNQRCPMFDSPESAIDKTDELVSSQTKTKDFKENNPNTVFFTFGQNVELGMDYEKNWLSYTLVDSLRLQMIQYVQRITVQVYTSVCAPLAGIGWDPVKMLIDLPDPPPPKERLWDKIANWVADLLGIKKQWAELIMIAVIVVVPILVILILLAIFAPQVFPMMAKALAGFFKRRAMKKARSR